MAAILTGVISMANTIPYRFRLRRALAATWAALNDVLLDGELGWERDTGKLKAGNGADGWNSRDYIDRSIDLSLLRDVDTTGRADSYGLVWDQSAGKHKYAEIPGASSNPQAALSAKVLALSPKVYYKCDEPPGSTMLADSSGNGMDLTIQGSCILHQMELVEGGGSFAAPTSTTSANSATRADTSGLVVPMNYDHTQFVVMMLMTTVNAPVVIWAVIGSGETAATNAQTSLRCSNQAAGVYFGAQFWEHGSGSDDSINGPLLPTGIPFAFSVRKNSAAKTVDFFVNGDLVYTGNYTNEPTGGTALNSILGANVSGSSAAYFLGSNFAFFDSALTDEEIKGIAAAAGFSR